MITIDIAKARNIAHDLRKAKRAEEFAPLDQQIAFQIPGINIKEVEAKRQEIRDKYAEMQKAIDIAKTPEELKIALEMSKENSNG